MREQITHIIIYKYILYIYILYIHKHTYKSMHSGQYRVATYYVTFQSKTRGNVKSTDNISTDSLRLIHSGDP